MGETDHKQRIKKILKFYDLTHTDVATKQGYDQIIEMKDDKDKGTRRTQTSTYKHCNQLICNISLQLRSDLTLLTSCHIICTCVSCTVENVDCTVH